MSKGNFINFYLDYSKHSNQEQAKMILSKAQELLKAGAKGVAIIYSANYGQTVEIEKTYLAGDWNTHTNGANQATVIHDMLSLLGSSESALQGKMRIAPITTMPGGTQFASHFKMPDFHLGITASDLSRIKYYMDSGWDILGWQNQETIGDVDHPYAVGGGVAKRTMPKSVGALIQSTLIKYHTQYQPAVVA